MLSTYRKQNLLQKSLHSVSTFKDEKIFLTFFYLLVYVPYNYFKQVEVTVKQM